jgi:MraZ protein
VDDRELFQGYAINGIDLKGRVAVPATLRAAIEANGDGRSVMIARHECDPCLIGYDKGWARLLREDLRSDLVANRAANRATDRHNANRRAFGPVEPVPYDASGRFILPAFLRAKAELEDAAFFYGAGDTFEIWSPAVLAKAEGVDEEMKEVCAWLMAQRSGQ